MSNCHTLQLRIYKNFPRHAEEVLAKRVSPLDILEADPDIQPTFAQYLETLPPVHVRQYSISSSPLWNPQRVTLTISVVKAPALSEKTKNLWAWPQHTRMVSDQVIRFRRLHDLLALSTSRWTHSFLW